MARRLLLLAALAAPLLAAGCRGSCRLLAEKLCECATNTTDRDTCLRRAASNESSYPPSPTDEATCQPLIDRCDCRLIDTAEGKVRCGLAPAPPDAGS